MKKVLFNIFLFGMIFLNSGCNRYLDMEPDDRLTQKMVFNDIKRTRGWLSAIYNYMPDPFLTYVRDWGFPFISDDAQIAIAMGSFTNWARIVAYNNGSMYAGYNLQSSSDLWLNTYQKVRSAYIFQNNVKALPSQGLTEEDVAQMKSEARFLIAYYYERMLELYGPFPLVTSELPNDASTEELMLPRTPYEDIVTWLDNEFTELAASLPAEYTDASTMTGRPTKGVCLALKARLWLFAASPLFNGNSNFANIKNPDGTALFPATYDATKWQKAASATRELLDLAETGVYDLYKEYYNKTTTIDPFLSYQNLFINYSTNKELIFVYSGSAYTSWYNGIGNPRGFSGSGGYFGATQNLCDCYFMKNGLSPITGYNSDGSPIINASSAYTETGFTSTTISYPNTAYNLASSSGTAGVVTEAGVYNMYANREPRFYISLWYNNEYIPKVKRYTQYYNGGLDGGPTHDSPVCGIQVRKGINPAADVKNNSVPYQPKILLRLGEFYLNYAEALNEVSFNNNKTEILKYVNLIRERAGIPIYGSDATKIAQGTQVQAPTNQDDMRIAIRKERRVEFGAEGDVRYNDIRRWKISTDVFNTPIYGMNTSSTTTSDFYKRVTYMTRKVEEKFNLWPIPQTYLDNNTNLVQNYGW